MINQTKHEFLIHNSLGRLPIESDSIHLVITSPPYPMIEMWDDIYNQYDHRILKLLQDGDGDEAFEAMHRLLDTCWSEVSRILIPGGWACINIGDATRSLNGIFRLFSNHSRVIKSFDDLGLSIMPAVIWRKPTNSPTKFMGSGMLPGGAYVTLEHEHILIFRKGQRRYFLDAEKKFRAASALFWEERNTYFSDLWEFKGRRQNLMSKADRDRSAAFPLELAKRLIRMYSVYGDTVVDPFAGTGTTSQAALLCARNSIAIDADERLINQASRFMTKKNTKVKMNEDIIERIKQHDHFVASKGDLFFRYKNAVHGFPVKTMQEKKLTCLKIKSIVRQDRIATARYQKIRYPLSKESLLAMTTEPGDQRD